MLKRLKALKDETSKFLVNVNSTSCTGPSHGLYANVPIEYRLILVKDLEYLVELLEAQPCADAIP